MTDQTTTAQDGAVRDTDGQTGTTEGSTAGEPDNGTETPDVNKSLAEANARYRTERDAAREELTTAHSRIERMQRAEVERLAANGLSHPADLFSLSGNELSDYLTEDGEVDAVKVADDVAAVLAERPGLRRHAPAVDPSQNMGGKPQRKPSWGALFKD